MNKMSIKRRRMKQIISPNINKILPLKSKALFASASPIIEIPGGRAMGQLKRNKNAHSHTVEMGHNGSSEEEEEYWSEGGSSFEGGVEDGDSDDYSSPFSKSYAPSCKVLSFLSFFYYLYVCVCVFLLINWYMQVG